jgi:hypothetical protein
MLLIVFFIATIEYILHHFYLIAISYLFRVIFFKKTNLKSSLLIGGSSSRGGCTAISGSTRVGG